MDGPLLRVVVDVGLPVAALVTHPSAEALRIGDEVAAMFKASAIHLIPKG